jgi:hypothetical protein
MSEWIAVCGEEGSDPIEIETEDGKSNKLSPLFHLTVFYTVPCFLFRYRDDMTVKPALFATQIPTWYLVG